MSIQFGRDTTGNLSIAETKEWLVTNGLGSYGAGTIAGSMTRGYHGLLVTAHHPPVDRRLMLVKLDETIVIRGHAFDLTTNRWGSGSVAPQGYRHIENFELKGSAPYWRYACADYYLEKRIWMKYGQNVTYVAYTLIGADEPVELTAKAIVNNRPYHNTGEVNAPQEVQPIDNGVRIAWNDDYLRPLTLKLAGSDAQPANEFYQDFYLPVETSRGLNDHDTHVHAATFRVMIHPNETVLFFASAEDDLEIEQDALQQRQKRDHWLLEQWQANRVQQTPASTPAWVGQLVLAADQFIVKRPSASQPDGKSMLAGFPWFEDWGRDTMISLSGLTLVTGQAEAAAFILKTFAENTSEGMLPNRFPGATDTPEYNTIDATFWYFQAIRDYYAKTGDRETLQFLYPTLQDIIQWHQRGTRYQIQVDPDDQLLSGGVEGVQLTWMDAKVGDHVITPRMGKPIEVNALWYNAICSMAHFADELGQDSEAYRQLAQQIYTSFQRFWNSGRNYCYDVLDGPNGHEDHLRPNQIFAVSLPDCPLTKGQQRAVVDAVSQSLVTSHGLRSLSPHDSEYVGSYGGPAWRRDGAYHQGTVWGWLIGPYAIAHYKVYQDKDAVLRFLYPFGDHLSAAGLGTISEIFNGDAPFEPKGCFAQAWSVGQVLYAFDQVERQIHHKS